MYYGGITQNNAGQLWRDLRDAMPDVALMGPDGVYENEFLEAAAAAAEGSYITFGGVPPDQLTGKGKEFVDKYTAKYPNNPVEGYTAYGYEAAQVVLAAIERAAAKNPADVLALRALVLDEVKATKDYDGVLGKWSFDADGDTSATDHVGLDHHRRRVQVRLRHRVAPLHRRGSTSRPFGIRRTAGRPSTTSATMRRGRWRS